MQVPAQGPVSTSASPRAGRVAYDQHHDYHQANNVDEEAWLGAIQALIADGHESGDAAEVLEKLRAAEAAALQHRQLDEADAEACLNLEHSGPTNKRSHNDASYYASSEETWLLESDSGQEPSPPKKRSHDDAFCEASEEEEKAAVEVAVVSTRRAAQASPMERDDATLPLSAVLPGEIARLPSQEKLTRSESYKFYRYLVNMAKEEANDVATRYHSFCAEHRRRETTDTSTFLNHTIGSSVEAIPINVALVYFSLWFLCKFRRQVLKLPSRQARQETWDYFYVRLNAIQVIVTRVLDGNHETVHFRKMIKELFSGDSEDGDNQD
jgi:hypothetical protein